MRHLDLQREKMGYCTGRKIIIMEKYIAIGKHQFNFQRVQFFFFFFPLLEKNILSGQLKSTVLCFQFSSLKITLIHSLVFILALNKKKKRVHRSLISRVIMSSYFGGGLPFSVFYFVGIEESWQMYTHFLKRRGKLLHELDLLSPKEICI